MSLPAVPKETGWYWISYPAPKGRVKCPCYVCHFDEQWIISTARNDSFYSHTESDLKGVKFGPEIPVPEDFE